MVIFLVEANITPREMEAIRWFQDQRMVEADRTLIPEAELQRIEAHPLMQVVYQVTARFPPIAHIAVAGADGFVNVYFLDVMEENNDNDGD
jgi:hypothetical protein